MWVVQIFLGMGIFFGILGNIGVLKFPDIYTRLQASSKCSVTSVFSILIACMLLEGLTPMTGRVLVITLFFSHHSSGYLPYNRKTCLEERVSTLEKKKIK